LTDAHTFINSVVVSTANVNNQNLAEVMDVVTENYNQFIEYNSNNNHTLSQIWQQVPSVIRSILEKPEAYLGYAVELAEKESENKL